MRPSHDLLSFHVDPVHGLLFHQFVYFLITTPHRPGCAVYSLATKMTVRCVHCGSLVIEQTHRGKPCSWNIEWNEGVIGVLFVVHLDQW